MVLSIKACKIDSSFAVRVFKISLDCASRHSLQEIIIVQCFQVYQPNIECHCTIMLQCPVLDILILIQNIQRFQQLSYQTNLSALCTQTPLIFSQFNEFIDWILRHVSLFSKWWECIHSWVPSSMCHSCKLKR